MNNWIQRNVTTLILIALTIATIVSGILFFRPHSTNNKSVITLIYNKDSVNSIIYTSPNLLYQSEDNNDKYGALFGGLFTGFIIAVIEFLIAYDERKKLDLIKALKVKNVLFTRGDEGYYRSIIKKSKIEIRIMGVTAYRFLNDFANTESLSLDKKVLIDALNRGVKVQILLPSCSHLSNAGDQGNYEIAKTKMLVIHQMYPQHFNFKYFNHTPAHSIFNVDDETIIGPVIPGINSKDTPGIHVLNSSKYALTYLDYFKTEWQLAQHIT